MILIAVMLLVGLTSVTIAQQKDSDDKGAKPSRVTVDVVKLTGTVKAIDLEKKTATVEGSGGEWSQSMRRMREIWTRSKWGTK
jgi:Cu/Ag efflux protein CusF